VAGLIFFERSCAFSPHLRQVSSGSVGHERCA
jgi:hypothetical protein